MKMKDVVMMEKMLNFKNKTSALDWNIIKIIQNDFTS